jgi:hypothetical protein
MLSLNVHNKLFSECWLITKKRRKKATIQGHQILGCKYTPAKGMESCEKNEQCKLVAL